MTSTPLSPRRAAAGAALLLTVLVGSFLIGALRALTCDDMGVDW
jgi:hypothetical protein